MPRPRVLLVLLLVTACTADRERPDPDAELRAARARLATLARATANGTYDAEYRFVQLPSTTSGTIRIRQDPPQYRIDIASKDNAAFFALTTGVVSCSVQKPKSTCFLVARPGEEVPALFDPGVQRLFRDAVEDLAANPGSYLVRTAPQPSATVPVTPLTTSPATATTSPAGTATALPEGECFVVERVGLPPEPPEPVGFEDGTYCFAEQGVATAISVASGSLTLTRLYDPPRAEAFTPPAKVQRLPELSPTPTRSGTPRPTATP